MVLSEKQRIEVLVLLGFKDRMRSQSEACPLFNAKYPENHVLEGTVIKIFHIFEEHGTVKDLPRSGRPLDENKTLDIALSLQKDPHLSTVSLAQNHAAYRRTIGRFLKTEKYHSYKIYLVQELCKITMISVCNFVRKR